MTIIEIMHQITCRAILYFITILCFFFFSTSLYAQSRCHITGRVVDNKNAPIPYASVALYRSTLPLTGAVTDNEGYFSLKVESSDTVLVLAVEFIGYSKYRLEVMPNKSQINLGTMLLEETAVSLDEFVVAARESAQRKTIEHTSLNASAALLAEQGTALDILRSSSAVTVSNDVISIRGNSNVLVLMDGVPTTIGDLSAIPSASIKTIDIITNPDASYDAEGTGGIINIISRKNIQKGLRGMFSANYGFNHFANGNLAFTYATPKTAWRFTYNAKYEDDLVNSSLDRYVHSLDKHTFQQMKSDRYTFNNTIALGADFTLSPKHKFSLDAKCLIPRLNIEQQIHNRHTQGGVLQQEDRTNDVSWNRENLELALTYSHVFKPQVSSITCSATFSKTWGHRPSFYSVAGVMTNRSNSGGSPTIPTLQADYKHKFKAGTLAAGLKFTYRRNDIYHQFYSLENGEWVYSDELSNDLLHTELIPAAYALFSSTIGQKFSYKVGLRAEYSCVSLNSSHEHLDKLTHNGFLGPTLSMNYDISQQQDVALAFGRRIGRPTYPQLNPYMSMVDASTFEQGNMYLSPEKSTRLDVSYSFRKEIFQLFANGYFVHTKDYISQISRMENDILITTYANAPTDWKAGLDFTFKILPCRWMDITLASNTYYIFTEGMYDGLDLSNSGWTNNSNISMNLQPWKGMDIQLQYFLTTPQHFLQLTTTLSHQMNFALKQRFLNNSLTASVLLTDVFNTYSWQVYSNNPLFNLTNQSKNKSRMLWLGLSYNINSYKHKGEKKQQQNRNLIKLGL